MRAFTLNRFNDPRRLVSVASMEAVITAAVKKADPCCAAFVGVFVERTSPKTRLEPNWVIKGIKFGRADRERARQILAAIVEPLQREFILSAA